MMMLWINPGRILNAVIDVISYTFVNYFYFILLFNVNQVFLSVFLLILSSW
jgi:hypothetical protein